MMSRPGRYEVTSMMVGPYSREGGAEHCFVGGTMSSGTYQAANKAFFYPIYIPSPCTVYKLWWANGAAVSGKTQLGLYLADGTENAPYTRLINGTQTTNSGTNVLQFDDITDTAVAPGRYYVAIWCDNTTQTNLRVLTRQTMHYQQDSLSSGLPATATPAAPSTYVALCGLSTRSAP